MAKRRYRPRQSKTQRDLKIVVFPSCTGEGEYKDGAILCPRCQGAGSLPAKLARHPYRPRTLLEAYGGDAAALEAAILALPPGHDLRITKAGKVRSVKLSLEEIYQLKRFGIGPKK